MPATALDCPPITDRAGFAAFYREQGYAIARGVVRDPQLGLLTRDFNRVVAQLEASGKDNNARWNKPATDRADGGARTVVIHTHNIQSYAPSWARFCFDEAFLDATELLLGPDIVLHHTKLFMKPAGIGAPFPPHQDWSYFPAVADEMLAASLYLTDSDEDNGCVRVWPGSHRCGRIEGSNGDGDLDARFRWEDSVPAIMAPGDILFFSYLTVHASKTNRSQKPRKSVLFQMHSGRDRIEQANRHPNVRLVLRGWNHAMERSLA